MAGLVVYFVWQVLVAIAAALAWYGRVSGGPCRAGPVCRAIEDWGDPRVSVSALVVITVSLPIILLAARLSLAMWRGRFWAGFATRILGWVTVVGGALLILLGGLPWLLLGAWLVYGAARLRYEPPAWAEAGPPPPDPLVIEGERV